MRDYAKGDVESLKHEKLINFKNFVNNQFSLRSASSKAFALVLASKNPKSLLDGTPVNTARTLSIINKNEYHHLFPKNFLAKSKIDEKKINVHANFCMTSLYNNRTISDYPPSIYFSTSQVLLQDKLHEVFETNFISQEAFEVALKDDYNEFVNIRSELIINYMRTLIDE